MVNGFLTLDLSLVSIILEDLFTEFSIQSEIRSYKLYNTYLSLTMDFNHK